MPEVYEFFAGGGMARAGLGPGWSCAFANDLDPAKCRTYRANWDGGPELVEGDIHDIGVSDLPGTADLMWGSFPCQDLSLAGAGAGLVGGRSGAFHGFWRLVQGLVAQGRGPRVVAIENVCGTLTSRAGADFAVICTAFAAAGYRWGALVVDAEPFLPQSRPRLFVIGTRTGDVAALSSPSPLDPFHPPSLRRAEAGLPPAVREAGAWWRLPCPTPRSIVLADLLEPDADVTWRSDAQTAALIGLMAPLHRQRVDAALRSGDRAVGSVFRRTRPDGREGRVQRAEVRFDGVAGCLRTPAGGSSRQILLVADQGRVRTRLITPRETARLMGLGDDYILPARDSEAYHVTGDGVAAPVVAHLARHLIEPLLGVRRMRRAA